MVRWRLASGGADGIIFIWDPETGSIIRQWRAHSEWIFEIVSFCVNAPTGRIELLASCSADRVVKIWGYEGGSPRMVLQGHRHWVRALVAIPGRGESPLVASGSDDGTIRLWDACGGV